MIQFKILQEDERSGKLAIHETEIQTAQARLAIRFAEIILASSDYGKNLGEAMASAVGDRQSYEKPEKPVAVETICRRACDMAAYLTLEMKKREWIIEGPDVNEVYKA